MLPIPKEYAKAIINKLGSSGTPPEFGLEFFTIGLDKYLKVIEEEYLTSLLKFRLSSFKMVVGNYGGGKTHFLYLVRNLAFKNNYVCSYVALSPVECPFDKLELVYRQVILNLMPPLKEEDLLKPLPKGIDFFIKSWYYEFKNQTKEADSPLVVNEYLKNLPATESSSFSNAVKAAFQAYATNDEEGYATFIQYLKGEEIPREVKMRFRISEKVEKTNAFRMIRSLAQWVVAIGYSGLILLFDEAERGISISSSKDKRRALDNLRQIIDECGNARLPGVMVFYAVPNEEPLLDGTGGVYEALKQRLRSSFTKTNPSGARINLEDLDVPPEVFLERLGKKLAEIFSYAYSFSFSPADLEKTLNLLIKNCLSSYLFDVSYRRLFILALIEAFYRLKENPGKPLSEKEIKEILHLHQKELAEKEKEEVEKEEF
ncbi:MAG: BREX system ATP-binding domain-containing protein [candidate division WOR-3 bacterium]